MLAVKILFINHLELLNLRISKSNIQESLVRVTQRTPDAGDSVSFQTFFLLWSFFYNPRGFCQLPSAGNANRYIADW